MVDVEAVSDLGRLPSAGCIEDVIEAADVLCLAIDPDLNSEAPVLRMDMNSIKPRLVARMPSLVPAVFSLAHIAKIADPVIARISIYVINRPGWHRAVLVEPGKPVRFPYSAENAYPDVATAFRGCTHNVSSFPAWEFGAELISARILPAREYPGFRVIMNVFFKLFLGDHFGTLVKAVEGLRQPLTRWVSGCIPSRAPSLTP